MLQDAIQRATKQLEEKGVVVNESQFLTEQDCAFLVSYFVTQLLFVCSEKHYDYKITSTAATFLTRFYLKRSVLEFDPRRILLTCILIAIKSEDLAMAITLHHFCDGLISAKGIRLSDVIDSELVVLSALDFHLLVLHPRTPIHYLTTEYYRLHCPPRISTTATADEQRTADEAHIAFGKLISEINREAEHLALQAFSSPDLPFLYTPSQIGIACFLHVGEGRLQDTERFVSSLFTASDSKLELFDSLRPKLHDLRLRLVLLTEDRQEATDEERSTKALTMIKKIDKLTKLLKGKKEKGNKRHKKPSITEQQTLIEVQQQTSIEITTVEPTVLNTQVTPSSDDIEMLNIGQ